MVFNVVRILEVIARSQRFLNHSLRCTTSPPLLGWRSVSVLSASHPPPSTLSDRTALAAYVMLIKYCRPGRRFRLEEKSAAFIPGNTLLPVPSGRQRGMICRIAIG